MGSGFLRIEASAADRALPLGGAVVTVLNTETGAQWRTTTNDAGETDLLALDAPDKDRTLDPAYDGPVYSTYDVRVELAGYTPVQVDGVHIYDTVTSILPVNMVPGTGEGETVVEIPPPAVSEDTEEEQSGPYASRVLREVVIPEYITVHLGYFSSNATNVRVRFADYIKNVASSEIYPTWPQAALEANILAQISFALNRVYTEWYRSRGYAFDITSSTATDQYYVQGREIFANISQIVDGLFNQYVRRPGLQEPYFTQFCNGTTVTCTGLSQWGTVTLANQGRSALEILRHYYPNDVEIVTSDNIGGIPQSYPGTVLSQGSTGAAVEQLQRYLNRIRVNYPLIPVIATPNGTYDAGTTAAVRTFQQIFDLPATGRTDSATWHKVSYLYVAVTKLAELTSEGERIGIGAVPPTSVLRLGARGADVNELQFILNFLAEFYPELPTVNRDASFGGGTETAVRAFQARFGLGADGVVGPATWRKLYEVYHAAENVDQPGGGAGGGTGGGRPAYPGYLLAQGSRGDAVVQLQRCLNRIGGRYPDVGGLGEDGIFGPATRTAVMAFQRQFGLSVDGIVGPATWDKVMEVCGGMDAPAYPGYYLALGARGEDVLALQGALNQISQVYTAVPSLSADGIFGGNTRLAVMAFQRQFGLSVDGIVGPLTWEILFSTAGSL